MSITTAGSGVPLCWLSDDGFDELGHAVSASMCLQRLFKRSRLNNWTDVNEHDIKLFMAHVIVMGLIIKLNITKYWSSNATISTPFFGRYMGRVNFERVMKSTT